MSLYYEDQKSSLHLGDAESVMSQMHAESVDCVVTSPPYFGLRDYDVQGQLGSEETVAEYVQNLVSVFRQVRRVLTPSGTAWLNLGDSYARGFGGGSPGAKSATNIGSYANRRPGKKALPGSGKNIIGIPWRVALALQEDGWTLRSDIVWGKPNAMPESVRDRPSRNHEFVFLLVKSDRYYYDKTAVLNENSTPLRSIWSINTAPFKEAHFATFPPSLARRCILAGSPRGATILDPFSGSGTTGMVALEEGRQYVGIDINREYLDLSLRTRFRQEAPMIDALASWVPVKQEGADQ